eukprot:g65555.t1
MFSSPADFLRAIVGGITFGVHITTDNHGNTPLNIAKGIKYPEVCDPDETCVKILETHLTREVDVRHELAQLPHLPAVLNSLVAEYAARIYPRAYYNPPAKHKMFLLI